MNETARKVLIVEDSPTQAAVIAELVRQAGFQPAVYTALPRGINQVLAAEEPLLVLLDLRLMGGDGQLVADGFQICREIKRSAHRVPVIVVSAESDHDAYEWAKLQGADAFIRKPFRVHELTDTIAQVLTSC